MVPLCWSLQEIMVERVLHLTVDCYDEGTPYFIFIFIELHILVVINFQINSINKLTQCTTLSHRRNVCNIALCLSVFVLLISVKVVRVFCEITWYLLKFRHMLDLNLSIITTLLTSPWGCYKIRALNLIQFDEGGILLRYCHHFVS
jgi:hypothetical protein